MQRVLLTGSLGQLGSEIALELRKKLGDENVVVTDIRETDNRELIESGPFELIDVLNKKQLGEIAHKYKIDTVFHLAALLSATGEKLPQKAWELNMGGLVNVLELSRENGYSIFTPSSIAAFGPSTPKDNTPQDTIQRPTSMYGVTKVAGELLCDYYYQKFGVDVRGVRYPGIISSLTEPGGGTTDYAVDIYFKAVEKGSYTSFLSANTALDMMYISDAVKAAIDLMNTESSKLIHRNAFNVTAMAFTPEEQAESIKKYIPNFTINYDVDPVRQAIADSWPNSLDDSAARQEWNWEPEFNLDKMSQTMLDAVKSKFVKN